MTKTPKEIFDDLPEDMPEIFRIMLFGELMETRDMSSEELIEYKRKQWKVRVVT